MMDRTEAYRFMADAVRPYQSMPHDHLRALVGTKSSERCRGKDSSEYILDLKFRWAAQTGGPIAIDASIDSAGTWQLKRIERTVFVDPTPRAT